ncbi:nucleoid-associated protein [Vibrio natriegens]|uniref:hypothetical protein n=1 Tax=Vibrio natriegens TaxID=691 RepID=UPI001593E290|nr:hypothetical protein [Vibrio natriegens]NVC94612.1 nucleoid-associated protein [Vibrio natriegens]
MVAVHAMTVELEVDNSKSTVEPKFGSLWPLEGEDVSFQFIQQVELKFKRKNKFHSYYDEETGTDVASCLHKYFTSPITQEDFIGLVGSLAAELRNAIFDLRVSSKVTSSKIVFMHYKSTHDDDFGRLLAVMVDKKSGFDFTEVSLLPKPAQHINLESLKQAVSIDLDLFDACYPEQPENEAYLKFIRGSSSASYFRVAFGCKEKSDNGESLSNLYEAIEAYSTINNLGFDFCLNAEEKLTKFVTSIKDSDKSSFSIDQAATVIESALPESRKELENTFATFVNESELPINHYIEPTVHQINEHQWIDFSDQDNGLIARVHSSIEIGKKNEGKDVEFNESTRKLEIKIKDAKTREKILRMINKDS